MQQLKLILNHVRKIEAPDAVRIIPIPIFDNVSSTEDSINTDLSVIISKYLLLLEVFFEFQVIFF